MGRSPCCSKVGLNRGAWTALEDRILTGYIKAHGEGKWRNLPKRAGLKRCGKSCRLRWLNYLRPDIKRGNISHDEEDLIIRLHKLLGNRWSLIAGRLPGRTDNEIKNYWNTTLGKKANAQSSSASRQSKQAPPSKCKPEKLASEPRATAAGHSTSFPQAAQAIRTKATRCTKVVVSLESPPSAALPTNPPMDQPDQEYNHLSATDFHDYYPRGTEFLKFDCNDFRASEGDHVQVDDDDYDKNLYIPPPHQSLILDEPMFKDWGTAAGTSLDDDNDTLDLDSLASFLDIAEEWA